MRTFSRERDLNRTSPIDSRCYSMDLACAQWLAVSAHRGGQFLGSHSLEDAVAVSGNGGQSGRLFGLHEVLHDRTLWRSHTAATWTLRISSYAMPEVSLAAIKTDRAVLPADRGFLGRKYYELLDMKCPKPKPNHERRCGELIDVPSISNFPFSGWFPDQSRATIIQRSQNG
jgi:hypothetical protein